MRTPAWAKRSAVVAASAAMVLGITGSLTTASAATYWTFKNDANNKCLTASSETAAVWVADCTGGSNQQWDFINTNNGHSQLKNRADGKCLATDYKSDTNSVWTGTCNQNAQGQAWTYNASAHSIRSSFLTYLRTSPSGGNAVYTDISPDIDAKYYDWFGNN
jgi:hypothetical protein